MGGPVQDHLCTHHVHPDGPIHGIVGPAYTSTSPSLNASLLVTSFSFETHFWMFYLVF